MVTNKKDYNKIYRDKNRDKINAYHREYYKNNKEKHRALVDKWKEDNPEKLEEYRKKINSTPEGRKKRRDYLRKWRDKNRDKWNKYQREYKRKMKLNEVQELHEQDQSS